MNSKTIQHVIYIAILVLALWTFKPFLLFKPNGKPRLYGVGYDEEGYKKTLFTVHVVVIVFVVLLSVMVR